MKPPVLLSYNQTLENAAKIRLLAMRLRVRLRTVTLEEQSQPLGVLAGLDAADAYPAPNAPFAEPLLVFVNLSSAMLNQFLAGLRQAGLPSGMLKAVLTETNRSWDTLYLYAQLCEERDALAQQQPPVHSPDTSS
ncbi:MAG: DUF3783 domain-containing protein [Candidatus Limiplasma sp.]|nr:DUF3783 domain-containing protein [Candidatus Limiplasma sp.]